MYMSTQGGAQDEAWGPVLPAAGPPRPDLAVLVGAEEETVAHGEKTLDGAVARGGGDNRSAATVVTLLLLLPSTRAVQRPRPDAAVRRRAVQRVAVDGEGGDVGGVASEGGEALVVGRA